MHVDPVSSIESIGSIPFAFVAAALLLMGAYGGGRLLRAVLQDTRESNIWTEIVFVIVGLHLVGIVGVCLGSVGLLGGIGSLIFLGVLSIFGIAFALRARVHAQIANQVLLLQAARPSWVWMIVLPIVLLSLGPALNYPTGWDELVYHSVLPRRWLDDGWPAFYLDLPYSGFPSHVELLCWLVAPIESIVFPRLFIWICWLVGLSFAYEVFRNRSNETVGRLLTLALALSPVSLMISANCYVEAVLFMDLFAILYLLENPSRKKGFWTMSEAVLIGILVGGCATIKLTGAIAIFFPAMWYLNRMVFQRFPKERPTTFMGTMLLTSLLVATPYYMRTWLCSGNPFYPYFASWFTIDPNVLETSLYHHSIGSDAFGMRGAIAYLVTPILLAWDEPLFDGRFGWQWLVLVGLSAIGVRQMLAQKKTSERLWLFGVTVLLYSSWFFSSQQARFALPLFICVGLIASSCLSQANGSNQRLFGVLVVCCTFISVPWTHVGYYLASWERLFGIWNNTQYVDDSLEVGYVPMVAAIERLTPKQAHVLLLFENRSLYIPRKCVIGTPFFQSAGLTPPEEYSEPDKLVAYLQEQKFSHIILATKSIGPDRAGRWWNRCDSVSIGIQKVVEAGKLHILWTTEDYLILEVTRN